MIVLLVDCVILLSLLSDEFSALVDCDILLSLLSDEFSATILFSIALHVFIDFVIQNSFVKISFTLEKFSIFTKYINYI